MLGFLQLIGLIVALVLSLYYLAHVFAEIRRRKAAKAEQAAPSDEPEA